jgi:hypothetical protein
MRDCPFCGNEVPLGAARCKHCFSDLAAGGAPPKSNPFVFMLLLGLVLLAVGGYMAQGDLNQSHLGNVTVDVREKRIVMVHVGRGKEPRTEQVFWNDIAHLETVANERSLGGVFWEVFAVKNGGERVLLNRSEGELKGYAANLAKRIDGKEVVLTDLRTNRAPANGEGVIQ